MTLVFYCHSFTSKILPSHINSGVGKQKKEIPVILHLQYIASTQVVKLWYVKLYDDKHSLTHTYIWCIYKKYTLTVYSGIKSGSSSQIAAIQMHLINWPSVSVTTSVKAVVLAIWSAISSVLKCHCFPVNSQQSERDCTKTKHL